MKPGKISEIKPIAESKNIEIKKLKKKKFLEKAIFDHNLPNFESLLVGLGIYVSLLFGENKIKNKK